jgi:hypothetical protein
MGKTEDTDWLGRGIAGVALLLSAVWFYVQLSVWRAEGQDHMLTVIDILVTALLWAMLVWSIYRLRKKPSQAANQLSAVSVRLATLCWLFAEKAYFLDRLLEDLWHEWDNAGEKLVHPVALSSDIRDFGKDNIMVLIKHSNFFANLYEEHVADLKENLPNFKSAIIENGFPADTEYHILRHYLKEHGDTLKRDGDGFRDAWQSMSRMSKK